MKRRWTVVRADHCHPGYHLLRRDGTRIKGAPVKYGKCWTQNHGHFIEVMVIYDENENDPQEG